MNSVREVVSLGMEARTIAGMKVRQPLQSILVVGADKKIDSQYHEIILDELNIKNIIFESDVSSAEKHTSFTENLAAVDLDNVKNILVFLDTEMTPELQKEGNFREFLRQVQIMRKKIGLQVSDVIELKIDVSEGDRDFIDSYRDELERTAGVKNINYATVNNVDPISVNGMEVKIVLLEA